MTLHIAPISLRDANAYVSAVHRHHGPTRGHKLSLAVADDAGTIHGVAIIGRPVSRHLDAQGYIEVLRVATDGTPNVCSMLYGAARRVAREMGYPPARIITYTLTAESGASLRASGWLPIRAVAGGTWNRTDRPRVDKHPIGDKVLWAGARVNVDDGALW